MTQLRLEDVKHKKGLIGAILHYSVRLLLQSEQTKSHLFYSAWFTGYYIAAVQWLVVMVTHCWSDVEIFSLRCL